jgi:ATP-dependent protease HslVU (ClpYQ) peptidase subunit
MTCVVGLADRGEVWIGVDSLGTGSCGAYPHHEDTAKMFRKGDMLIGYSGEPRVAQIIQYTITLPERLAETPTMEYLVRDVIGTMRSGIEAAGWEVRFDPKSEQTWALVVGYEGAIYRISYDFQIERLARDFVTEGCGREWAGGSLWTTGGMPRIAPQERIRLALAAASELDIHVAAPFHIERL